MGVRRILLVAIALVEVWCGSVRADQEKSANEQPELVSEEKVHEIATRQTYSDGTIKLHIEGRTQNDPLTFIPSLGSAKMEQAKFMYGLARQVAPEMRTAGTVYTHQWWEPLENMLDLNIVHYVHPCHSEAANRRWRQLADRQHTQLFGIDFIGGLDSFWEGRQITLTAEKGQLVGMMCWTQWVTFKVDDDFQIHPYYSLKNYWKGGPWAMPQPNGRVWRSMAWLGLREGIDDSRYLRTARQWIETARQDLDPEHRSLAKLAQQRVKSIMDRVAWIPGVRQHNADWSSKKADQVRRELAQVALDLQAVLNQ